MSNATQSPKASRDQSEFTSQGNFASFYILTQIALPGKRLQSTQTRRWGIGELVRNDPHGEQSSLS
jgi:hypothetical protein